MSVVILSNIGDRDVYCAADGQEPKTFEGNRLSPRVHGRDLLDQLMKGATTIERFTAPIIDKARDFLEGPGIAHDQDIIRWLLFFTDQDMNDESKADRDKDTLYFARIIHKRYHNGYQYNREDEENELRGNGYIACNCEDTAERIDLVKIEAPPHQYADCFDFYKKKLKDLFAEEINKDGFRPFVVAAGGTPACNTGLLLASIGLFEDRTRQIYVPHGQDAHEIGFGELVLRDYRLARIRSHLDNYQFAAALQVIDELKKGSQPTSKLDTAYLLTYSADRRINFDFPIAKALFNKAKSEIESIESIVNSVNELSDQLEKLYPGPGKKSGSRENAGTDEQGKAFVEECYWHVIMALQHEKLVKLVDAWHRFDEKSVILALVLFDSRLNGIEVRGNSSAIKGKLAKLGMNNIIKKANGFGLALEVLNQICAENGAGCPDRLGPEKSDEKKERLDILIDLKKSRKKCEYLRAARNDFVHELKPVTEESLKKKRCPDGNVNEVNFLQNDIVQATSTVFRKLLGRKLPIKEDRYKNNPFAKNGKLILHLLDEAIIE